MHVVDCDRGRERKLHGERSSQPTLDLGGWTWASRRTNLRRKGRTRVGQLEHLYPIFQFHLAYLSKRTSDRVRDRVRDQVRDRVRDRVRVDGCFIVVGGSVVENAPR